MAYSKTTWSNGITPLNAQNMNKIEAGIFENSKEVTSLKAMIGDPEKTAAAAALVAALSDDPSVSDLSARMDAIADYPVEIGTSGNWKYKKWSNGDVDLWGRFDVSADCTTAWGALFYTQIDGFTFPSGLFIEMPYLTPFFQNPNAWMIGGAVTKTETGRWFILSATSQSVTGIVTFKVKGRWK